MRIKAKNDIVNAAASGINITSSDLILESGQGGIGTSAKNVTVLLSASGGLQGTLTARALNDVYISTTGDLKIAGVQSQNAGVHLTAGGSILDGLNSSAAKLAGNVIDLSAGADIGASTNWLETDHTFSGTLHATAAGSIWLHEVDGNMNVDRITSTGGDVNLRSHLSIVDASTATGESSAKPGADILANANVTLIADVGAIGISGNDIDIDSARGGSGNLSITSFLGANIIEVAGNLSIDTITAGSAYTAFIAAPLGSILNGRSSGNNVVSGKAFLFAKNDIGASTKAFLTAVGNLEGQSTLGNAYITNTGAMTIGGVTGSSTGIDVKGSVNITTMSPMKVKTKVKSDGDITLTSNDGAGGTDTLDIGYDDAGNPIAIVPAVLTGTNVPTSLTGTANPDGHPRLAGRADPEHRGCGRRGEHRQRIECGHQCKREPQRQTQREQGCLRPHHPDLYG